MTTAPAEDTLSRVAQGESPVLDQLMLMNVDALMQSGLDEKTFHLVRLAALVAMDAAPVSYLVNLGVAADSGMTLEQAQSMLIAIAPIVGSARVASAAGNILRALGFALDAAENG